MFLQVYEHVYETVDINSSPEVRANATAKVDPSHIQYLVMKKHLTCALFFFFSPISMSEHLFLKGSLVEDFKLHAINTMCFQRLNTTLFMYRLLWQLLQQVRDTRIHES